MSLDNPSKTERLLAWLKTPGKLKLIGILAGIGGVILLVLFVFDRCGTYWSDKKADKLIQNVNLALDEVKQAQANKANSDIDIAVKVEKLNEATNQALEAVNATDATKLATNAALANVNAAVAANRPVGTTGDDIGRQLDGLDIK